MAYVKNTWVDREGQIRYQETIDNDGALIFTPDYEKITEMGTPVNADNMNHIEEGIGEHENRITVLENLSDKYLNKSQITNCILEAPNGVASYSGSTITVKSGIKVLIPNGKNEDGTLKNIEYTTDERVYTEQTSRSENAVITIAIDNNGRINAYVNYFSQEENPNTPYTCWYKPSENNFYVSDGESNFSLARIVPILFYKSSNLQITNVIPYNTVDLLKRSNKSEISGWGMPSNKRISLTLGATGSTYTAPSNGWFYFYKRATASGQYAQIGVSGKIADERHSSYSNAMLTPCVPVLKGDVVKCLYSAAGTTEGFYFSYAEGEI